MRSLNVIQVISSPWWTGAAEPALQLTADLAGKGHAVEFVYVPGEALEEKATEAGFPPVDGMSPTRSLNPLKIWKFVSTLAGRIDQGGTDVVHTHLTADHWLSALAARVSRCRPKLVRTVHHPRAAGGGLPARLLFNRSSDAVIAVNHHIANTLLNSTGVSPDALHVVPGGVDLEKFHPASIETRAMGREILGASGDSLLLGIVSRLAADRGYFHLFDAFRTVAREMPKARLVVVGKGEFLPKLKERVRRLSLEDRVDFVGYHEDDLVEVLAAFDVFVLMAPGSEGSCRAVLEAMAMGLPCVVTDRNGLAEIVRDGETARVAPYGENDLLASALLNLLSDRQRRVEYGKAGRERAERVYHRQRRAELVERVYADVLGVRSDSPAEARLA